MQHRQDEPHVAAQRRSHLRPKLKSYLAHEHVVLLAGCGERTRELVDILKRSSPSNINVMGMLDVSASSVDEERCQWTVDTLPELLDEQVIDEVLIDTASTEPADCEPIMRLCAAAGVSTRMMHSGSPASILHSFAERQHLERDQVSDSEVWALPKRKRWQLWMKRALDIVVSITALVVLSPWMLIVAILIRATSPGPVLFRQVRCGLNGQTFVFYKFRTMVAHAEQMRADLEHLNEKRIAFKIKNDPRITPIGRWLRRFSIDEWPQFWNILRGEMSLVGPRPPLPEEVAKYEPWQKLRLRTKPGLTCLWVLDGRDHVDFDHWVERDIEYIETWTFLLDLKILLFSVPCVITGKGAY